MEAFFSNKAKRKKRKTRKCLDEIRKRSQRTGQISVKKDSGKVCDYFSNHITVNNCLVTNNRLTLRMYPKAVRSETITRPVLEDLKEKPNLNLDELVKGTKAISTLSSINTDIPETNKFDKNIEHYKNENLTFLNKYVLEESINYKELSVKSMNSQDENLSSNFNPFTSLRSAEINYKSPDSTGAESVSTPTTSSNQSLHEDFGHHLYEQFMSEIPTYLKRNATFIEENIMKKTKLFLQNLFIESCCQECEENVLECKKDSPHEMIVHDPMNYIRLGHVQQQSLFRRPSRIERNFDGGGSIPQSPSLAPSLPAPSPNSPLCVILNDTPDYTYYPHRLN